ncbi:MAG TPA: alpha/beta hydrolase [Candidatus Limnocylindrales bacterium]
MLLALTTVLVGMLIVGDRSHDTSLCWILWFALGSVAGVIAGAARRIWVVAVALLLLYPMAEWLDLPHLRLDTTIRLDLFYWRALMAVGAAIVASGFALGAWVAGRAGLGDRIGRRPLIGGLGLGALGLLGWTVFAGAFGARELMTPDDAAKWADCSTPTIAYGWSYEAINYDQDLDAGLAAGCAGHQGTAGTDVRAGDGTPIAGWFIPAGRADRSTRPAIVIVPGWKSNKSEVLKYAPAFHDTFDLVLVDLRNGGRSGGVETTWGYRERGDVRAIIDWLVEAKHPSWIGVMGNSMGAATALAEAVGDERVEALILDSMHGTLVASVADGAEAEPHMPGYPTAWAAMATMSLRIGGDVTTVDPVRTITELGPRPVLLIHGTADILDKPGHSAERVLEAGRAAGVAIELAYCTGGTHGQLIDGLSDRVATSGRRLPGPGRRVGR